jgi:hypothetical protein
VKGIHYAMQARGESTFKDDCNLSLLHACVYVHSQVIFIVVVVEGLKLPFSFLSLLAMHVLKN